MADSLTIAITGLDREKNLLGTVVDALDDYLYTEDETGRLTMINKPLAVLLGLPADQALGRLAGEVVRLAGFQTAPAGEEGWLELPDGRSLPVRRQVRSLPGGARTRRRPGGHPPGHHPGKGTGPAQGGMGFLFPSRD